MSPGTNELIGEVRNFWRGIVRMVRDPYHPERHYMHGTGPKSLARARAVLDTSDMHLVVIRAQTRRRAR